MSPPTLDQLITWRLSRRDALKLGAATGLVSLLGLSQSACSTLSKGSGKPTTLSFKGVPISAADMVVVPEGYTSELFFAWGDGIYQIVKTGPDRLNHFVFLSHGSNPYRSGASRPSG